MKNEKLKIKKIKIGIVGCGAIGKIIADFIEKDLNEKAKIVGVCDIDLKKAIAMASRLKGRPDVLTLDKLVDKCDLIIEAASGSIVGPLLRTVIKKSKDALIMSAGGLLGVRGLLKLAAKKGIRIFVPSGALAGLDAVRAAAVSRIKKATLITRKPIKGLAGAPFLKRRRIDLSRIKKETIIFNGSVADAVKAFPQNINVAATLALCIGDPKKTSVKLITSPSFRLNSHEIIVETDSGCIIARTDNLPSKENPKTSRLAALSAAALIKNIFSSVKIGT